MVGIANQQNIVQIKSLWKEVFQDSDEFLDSYFSKILKLNDSFVVEVDNKVVTALQVLPFTFLDNSKEVPAAYIFAVMTNPANRMQGHMRSLFDFTFDELNKRGYAFAFLIPQEEYLFGVYQKLGFVPAFPVLKDKLNLPENDFKLIPVEVNDAYQFHIDFYSDKAFVKPSLEYYKFIFDTIYAEGGAVLAYQEEGRIQALAYAYEQGSEPVLLDLLCSNNYHEKFLGGLRNFYGCETAHVSMSPNEFASNQYLGMAKIFNEDSIDYTSLQKAYMSLMMND